MVSNGLAATSSLRCFPQEAPERRGARAGRFAKMARVDQVVNLQGA